MSELKAGDRALVIRRRLCCGAGSAGCVVVIDSRQKAPLTHCQDCGAERASDPDLPIVGGQVIHRARVIRLPPDDEAKRLFRETEKPVAA